MSENALNFIFISIFSPKVNSGAYVLRDSKERNSVTMAAAVRKLLRKPSYQRILPCLNNGKSSNLVAPPLLHKPYPPETKSDAEPNLNPCQGSSTTENHTHYSSFQIYPSFPFGYCLNPIPSPVLEQSQPLKVEEVDSDDSRTIWADSVKKKRKKKMNKHKYKKLRKRLRRRT